MTDTDDGAGHGRAILHCFADMGVESEALAAYGNVVRVGIDPRDYDANPSTPVQADASKPDELPFEEGQFKLGLFHAPCTRWANVTNISGDPEDHPNLIPEAREIGERYCEHYIIENQPQAPLRDPVTLDGSMWGLPIKYERAFETSFHVEQPTRQATLVPATECSPYFYSDRSRAWWASVKGYTGDYPKQHLAKNCLPNQYVHYLMRAYLRATNSVDAKEARSAHV